MIEENSLEGSQIVKLIEGKYILDLAKEEN